MRIFPVILLLMACSWISCKQGNDSRTRKKIEMKASDILGNKKYRAISYGGYRDSSRLVQPTLEELKEDMRILSALGIKLLRTYNVHFDHAENVVKAIDALKKEDENFEMYVMLGAWIDCRGAWTAHPDHNDENHKANEREITKAVKMAQTYPDIIKIIAVGNEAMVKWATSYYVQPWVILKYVQQLQELKMTGELSEDLWITSSDNFASWGGGDTEYHVDDLRKLIKAVDFVSMHTYPMHDTHYNSHFWYNEESHDIDEKQAIRNAMLRSLHYAQDQYESTKAYIHSVSPGKPIHIGETGWATESGGHYGDSGSRATDEYKQALYHEDMRAWTDEEGISCFYFEAFDEIWKDAQNPQGSENHFGLFDIEGRAKYLLWDAVDNGVFNGLTRGGHTIVKTYDGNTDALMKTVLNPLEVAEKSY